MQRAALDGFADRAQRQGELVVYGGIGRAARDWDAYERFLTSKLTPAPNVTHVKSALSIRTSKLVPGVPITVADGDNGAES